MGQRPQRSTRQPRERKAGRRSSLDDEEKRQRIAAQNAELEAEKAARNQAPSQFAVRSSSPGSARGTSADDAQRRLDAATAGLDAEDMEAFNEMMAAEAAKLS